MALLKHVYTGQPGHLLQTNMKIRLPFGVHYWPRTFLRVGSHRCNSWSLDSFVSLLDMRSEMFRRGRVYSTTSPGCRIACSVMSGGAPHLGRGPAEGLGGTAEGAIRQEILAVRIGGLWHVRQLFSTLCTCMRQRS